MPEKALDSAVLDAIRGSDIFSSLGPEELALIGANVLSRDYSAGEAVFQEGEPGNALYIVVDGRVSVEGRSDDGKARSVAELIAGETFGELELFTGAKRTAGVRALEASRLLAFPAGDEGLGPMMEAHPAVAAKLLRSMMAALSARIRKANGLIKENSPLVRELRNQVYGDKLSGLYNKTWLEEVLPALCGGQRFALLMLKPDNFKEINDRFGHEAGDRVIILMAAELKRAAGEGNTAFRFAGNEIGLLLPGAGRDAASAKARAIQAALVAMSLGPAVPGGAIDPGFMLSVSVGLALHPDHGSTGEAMIAAVNELPLAGRARGGGLILFPEDIE